MPKDETKNITKQEPNELDYLKQDNEEMMGTDNIDKEDIIMARLKVVQGQTKEKFGIDPGNLFHSISGKNYGKIVKFVPILHWKSHIMFDAKLNIECRSFDGKVKSDGKLTCIDCGKFRFGEDGSKPDCNRVFNYLIAEEAELKAAIENKTAIDPLSLTFMSSSTKMAKQINTQIKMNDSNQYPIYSQFFKIEVPVEEKTFETGSAFQMMPKPDRYASEEEAEYLATMFKAWKTLRVELNITDEDYKESTGESSTQENDEA